MKRAPRTTSPPPDRPPWRADLAIFGLALALRLVFLFELARSPLFGVVAGDAASYDAWARTIAEGDWLGRSIGVFFQAPLYPYFLGVIYALAGPGVWVPRLVKAVLGAASCVLLARTGRRLLSPAAGTLAGLLLAVYPAAIYYDSLLQKTTLDLFFLCLLLLLLAPSLLGEALPRWRLAAAGAAGGLLLLTRENAALLLALAALWLLLRAPGGRRRRLGAVALVVAGAAAVLLPVGVRNRAIGGEFHLSTSQFGVNFYLGNNPQADGFYHALLPHRGNPEFERQDTEALAEQALGRTLTPGEVSSYWAGKAFDFIRAQPLRFLEISARKLLLLLNSREVSDIDDFYGTAGYSLLLRGLSAFMGFGLVLSLAAAGTWLAWDQRRRLLPLAVVALVYAASVVAFIVYGRYRFPLVPLLLLPAAAGLVRGWSLLRERRWRPLIGPALLAVATAAVTALPLVPVDAQRAGTELSIGNHLLRTERRASEAIGHYERALALEPRLAKAHLGLADAFRAEGRLEQALASYQKTLELAPDLEAAAFNAGSALADAGRHALAATLLQRAVELNPERGRTRTLLGNSLFALGRVGEAASAYTEAVRLDAGDARAHNNLGTAYAALGRLPEAAAAFRAALALDPAYVEAQVNLGKALLALGARAEASAVLAAAAASDPNHEGARRWLAHIRGSQPLDVQ